METMAEEIDSLRKILSEVQTGSRAGHAGENELGRSGRTGTDRIRPERPEPPTGKAPGHSQPGQSALPDPDRNRPRPKEVGRWHRRPADLKTTTHFQRDTDKLCR